MASKSTIDIVKSTAPVLKQHGETITKVFYRRLFENHPEMKDIFNLTHQRIGDQPKALANAIFKYACHIDDLKRLGSDVESINQKHASLGITPAMYPIVGENLLESIKEVLGEAATPEVINAWAEAYGDLAAVFVKKEEGLYAKREKDKGGFRGTKAFVVVKKVKESDVITSFYLKRKDNAPVPKFTPGQYISLTVDIPGHTHKNTRNYSLSDCPSKDYLRISVKKETGNPNGIVSNYLHASINEGDALMVGMPSGEFTLKNKENPLVLISGGVGITPLMSMFKSSVDKSNRPVHFIQCALNSSVHAFQNEILTNATRKTKFIVVYDAPLAKDEIEKKNDFKGFLTLDILKKSGISHESDFYFCGPKPFMANTVKILKEFGVKKENVNFEFFGPKEELA